MGIHAFQGFIDKPFPSVQLAHIHLPFCIQPGFGQLQKLRGGFGQGIKREASEVSLETAEDGVHVRLFLLFGFSEELMGQLPGSFGVNELQYKGDSQAQDEA